MNLQELQENKKTKVVKRALKEHYDLDINFDQMNLSQTQRMLGQVRGLLKESRVGAKAHSSHRNSAYLKLVMLEQALTDRLGDLRNYRPRIVVENEEVMKSQVILAAQDLVDTLQKMLEDVSKMKVEELNAVVDGIKNEFGSSQGQSFQNAVSGSLEGLENALQAAKTAVQGALDSVSGGGEPAATDMGLDQPVEPGMETPPPGLEAPEEVPGVEAAPEEEPEELDTANAGRERR